MEYIRKICERDIKTLYCYTINKKYVYVELPNKEKTIMTRGYDGLYYPEPLNEGWIFLEYAIFRKYNEPIFGGISYDNIA